VPWYRAGRTTLWAVADGAAVQRQRRIPEYRGRSLSRSMAMAPVSTVSTRSHGQRTVLQDGHWEMALLPVYKIMAVACSMAAVLYRSLSQLHCTDCLYILVSIAPCRLSIHPRHNCIVHTVYTFSSQLQRADCLSIFVSVASCRLSIHPRHNCTVQTVYPFSSQLHCADCLSIFVTSVPCRGR
jgi:hypothetical protein